MTEKAFSGSTGTATRRLRPPTGASVEALGAWRTEARGRLSALLRTESPDSIAASLTTPVEAEPGGEPQLVELSVDGTTVPAWLLRPAEQHDQGRAVVALAGHGPGIDALVDPGSPVGDYHGGVARKLQAAGFTVLCPELTSFGRRRTSGPGEAASSCQVDAMRGLLTGRPVLGRRVDDTLAAVSVARSLPGVDAASVSVLGGSGGGAVALLAAALDDRICAAVVATFFSSFEASFCSVPHCICNAVPDLLSWFEMADLAALIAPRTLIIEAGEADSIFPVAATHTAYDELVRTWAAFDARPPELIVTPAGHQFLADRAIAALSTSLDPAPAP